MGSVVVDKMFRYKGFNIYYQHSLDGSGREMINNFAEIIKNKFSRVERLCEFACGPGFIGFSLLADGLCKELCLIDINPVAIKYCRRTIASNGLEKVVTIYASDVLEQVPREEKWDLVVSNPPHFKGTDKMRKGNILAFDPNWNIHKKFYKNISGHLKAGGAILFVENKDVDAAIFRGMIGKNNGLALVKTFNLEMRPFDMFVRIYRIIVSLKGIDINKYVSSFFKVRNFKKITGKIYPYYFVWSKKV